MFTVFRTGVGLALAGAGLTLLTYGVAQAIENGSCGTDEYGNSVGPPCPSGFAAMIILMVFGTFVALFGAALASALLRFLATLFLAVIAGVVFGIVDLNPDDTRPGLEIVAAVAAAMVLFVVPFVGRRPSRGVLVSQTTTHVPESEPAPATAAFGTASPPQWQPRATTRDAEGVAARLRQLDELKAGGLLDDAAYAEQRRRILAEL